MEGNSADLNSAGLNSIELNNSELRNRALQKPWADPASYWGGFTAATADEPAPVVAMSLEALSYNATDLTRRAGGIPVRVASKSIRVREVLEAVLRLPSFQGVLAYTLAEALWLASSIDDVVVAYPSVDRRAIAELAQDEKKSSRVTVMLDSPAQLDLIDAVANPSSRNEIRVCLDFDASWWAPVIGNVGVFRSPIHEPGDLRALAEEVIRRPGFKLVGVMSYEAQIAGVGNAPVGKPLVGRAMRELQKRSAEELSKRRAEALSLVTEIQELEFINGGGTGSLEQTASEGIVTEVAAGSGLFGPHLFDNYAHFQPAPAVAFALDVVRKARPDNATVLGGGWIASGAPGADRLPQPVWPEGLKYSSREGAGEVQTPLLGQSAADLKVGERVWFRHTKSGEVMEHTREVLVLNDNEIVARAKTYRGEGMAFL
ncbi:MAG TPA: amino acid deaminase/aldolase [Microbacteriaceae bacterium]|nr:amino acid deaminase/aldolase [Microbacteriaceae bacterium]